MQINALESDHEVSMAQNSSPRKTDTRKLESLTPRQNDEQSGMSESEKKYFDVFKY